MIKFWNDYLLPRSIEDALDLLTRYQGRARVVAGGTDLLLDFQDAYITGERPHFDALVDVTRIQGATAIREDAGWIVVGCGVTHAQVVASPLVQAHAIALVEACSVVGGSQVRNVATLVGNVAHALPAADGTIALTALGAEAQVASTGALQGSFQLEWRPLASLYKGPGQSDVDPTHELIAAIRVRPAGTNEGSAFTRVMRPQGVALPILGMAARVRLSAATSASTMEDVAIASGPVAPVPFRAARTESFLRGKVSDSTVLTEAGRILLEEVAPRTSAHRATREYRLELLPSMLSEVVARAVERASVERVKQQAYMDSW